MKKVTIIFIAIIILCYTSIYAFDDERKGFIIGAGLGVGYLSNTTSLGSSSETNSQRVFLLSKIGYAPSNTLEIFYFIKMTWRRQSDGTYSSLGLQGAALTLYLDNTSETGWFVSGGIGIAGLKDSVYGESSSREIGFALFGGAGYEFSKLWTVEVDLLYSTVSEDDSDTNSFGVLVTVNFLKF